MNRVTMPSFQRGLVCLTGFFLVFSTLGTDLPLSDPVSIARDTASDVVKSGDPSVSFLDAADLQASYSGPVALVADLESGLAEPLALAMGDFDEDGLPDLASAFVGPSGSLLTLHRGNRDAVYPYFDRVAHETAAPFYSEARVYAAPARPDFLGAGDFDNDGHLDLVAATEGFSRLHLLRGDGQGHFTLAPATALPGTVTMMLAADLNARDGLADLAVGIQKVEGAALLLFNHPDGALNAHPEAIALPNAATALASYHLDTDGRKDLAVAAGREVLIVHGRGLYRTDAAPEIDRHIFPGIITAVEIGDFADGREMELAAMAENGTLYLMNPQTGAKRYAHLGLQGAQLARARVSSHPKQELVLTDRAGESVHILHQQHFEQMASLDAPMALVPEVPFLPEARLMPVTLDVGGAPVALMPMRLNHDGINDLAILKVGGAPLTAVRSVPLATFTVDSTGDSMDATPGDGSCDDGTAACTLRAAIMEANALAGPDMITFDIVGGGPTATIAPGTPLPTIVESVTIDGFSQFGASPTPPLILTGSGTVAGEGLLFGATATSSLVSGLVINDFGGTGITSKGDDNTFEANFIGTDASGTSGVGNGSFGIFIEASSNTVGGTRPFIVVPPSWIPPGNVISGNSSPGVEVDGFPFGATGSIMNVVNSNYIGTDLMGSGLIPNGFAGVRVFFAADTDVGGATPGLDGNVISGNAGESSGDGVVIGDASSTLVQQNTISSNGDAGVGNGVNIVSDSDPARLPTDDNLIGGTAGTTTGGCTGVCNLISLNLGDGVRMAPGAGTGNAVTRNALTGNGGLGINLCPGAPCDGVTPNDVGDPDSSPNKLQNFPVISSVSINGSSELVIEYCVDTDAVNATYPLTVEFFKADAAGQGASFLGDDTYSTTDLSACPGTPKSANLGDAASLGFGGSDEVVATATDDDGNTSEFSGSVELPVELVAFEAAVEGMDAVLRWETASETRNAGFEVQHRGDVVETWEVLGFVEGRGTTTEPQQYTYRAEDLDFGTHRFRFKQVDFDGTFVLSAEVEVQVELPGAYHLSEAYPNPFNPQAQFTLTVKEQQRVRIMVYDAAGREVAVLHDGRLEANRAHLFRLDGSTWPSGLYLIRVVGQTFAASQRVVLVK